MHQAAAKPGPSQSHAYKVSARGAKCELFKMREESAPSRGEKAESGVRKYTQVSVASELVKDNEVTGLLSLSKSGSPF